MRLLLLIIPLCICHSLSAQLKVHYPNQIDSLLERKDKDLVIYFGAEWCKYCRLLEETTFKHANVIAELNENFYFVHFDDDFRGAILINNQTYKYIYTGYGTGVHEFFNAMKMEDKTVELPSINFVSPQGDIYYQNQGYIDEQSFSELLIFVGKKP